ncbi:unnamed protein product [Adineta ricciae]|uniref:Sequestosome-1 n=1 Tax=Adineta ricciae TaxID=249248 RepID=A0A815K494_ADIRI|nr:unnamed protein product [Adineta ricciae]CAF1388361.1 unnamed protein product [Adineta ricciae]
MDNVYYIKAYFTKQGQEQPEIRRFKIDISSQNDAYQELHAKIASFQSNNDFTLQYLDEENERITFNSNDELRSAIALTENANTLKVYVTSSQPLLREQKVQEAANKEVHVGVECDSCKGPVIGFRYKCFVCPNYDLCEKCSAAGVHSEHNMIKITKPGNLHHPNGSHPHPHSRHHHIPPPPHHHIPPPPHHHIPPPPHHHVPPPPSFFPHQQFLGQVQSQIPQWLPNLPNTAHFRTHLQQHLDTIKTNTQNHVQNSRQYLESVGQYLQQTLSPFGIDCDYHVDDANPTPNQQQTTAAATQQEEQTTTAHDEPSREPDAVPKYPDLSSEGKTNNEELPPTKLEQESTPISNPIEKAIDDCLEKMQAMGFVDTNGALRELIRSKNGEMNAVLDAINPRHYQA